MRLFVVFLLTVLVGVGCATSDRKPKEIQEEEGEHDDQENMEQAGKDEEEEEEEHDDDELDEGDEREYTNEGEEDEVDGNEMEQEGQSKNDDKSPYHEGEETKTDPGDIFSANLENLEKKPEEASGSGSGSEYLSDAEIRSYLMNDDDKIPDAETLKTGSKADRVRVEGDIIIDRNYDHDIWKLFNLPENNEELLNKTSTRAIITGPIDKRWPGGVVPYFIHKSRMKEEKMIESAFKEYEEKTCLKFPRIKNIKKYKNKNYVKVVKGVWASSALGRSPVKRVQNINLHNGFLRGNLLHEIMHAIGFLHEHSRTDRGDYVTMAPKLKRSWNFLRTDHRGLFSDDMGLPYDYGSITHYPAYKIFKPIDDHVKVGQRIKLSDNDICQVNRLYGCHKKLEDLKLKCDCLDSYSSKTCLEYKKKGLCEKDQLRMKRICPNTCKLCCQSGCKVQFDKVGCFNDGVAKSEILKKKIKVSKRSDIPWVNLDLKRIVKRSTVMSVSPSVWTAWAKDKHLENLVCQCAKKAKSAKYKYFALRFPGECWGGNVAYYKDGLSSTCFDKEFKKCAYSNVACCTGMALGRFVYRL